MVLSLVDEKLDPAGEFSLLGVEQGLEPVGLPGGHGRWANPGGDAFQELGGNPVVLNGFARARVHEVAFGRVQLGQADSLLGEPLAFRGPDSSPFEPFRRHGDPADEDAEGEQDRWSVAVDLHVGRADGLAVDDDEVAEGRRRDVGNGLVLELADVRVFLGTPSQRLLAASQRSPTKSGAPRPL